MKAYFRLLRNLMRNNIETIICGRRKLETVNFEMSRVNARTHTSPFKTLLRLL